MEWWNTAVWTRRLTALMMGALVAGCVGEAEPIEDAEVRAINVLDPPRAPEPHEIWRVVSHVDEWGEPSGRSARSPLLVPRVSGRGDVFAVLSVECDFASVRFLGDALPNEASSRNRVMQIRVDGEQSSIVYHNVGARDYALVEEIHFGLDGWDDDPRAFTTALANAESAFSFRVELYDAGPTVFDVPLDGSREAVADACVGGAS